MTDQTAVAVAVIGLAGIILAALAGIGGALVGSFIGARATRHAATVAQAEAQADREETRRARFDDRIRELAAQILDSAARYTVGVAKRRGILTPLPDLEFDAIYRRTWYELQLVARLPETITAVQAIEDALYVIYDYDYQLHGPEDDPLRVGLLPDDSTEWSARHDEYEQAVTRFKAAIRAELGV